MKRIVFCSLILLFISCSGNKNLSPAETATIVAESFFSKDKSTLKKHTTSEGYASLNTLLDMIPDTEKEIEVDILDEAVDGEATWVKYSTSYDGKPGVFKLVQEDDQWKVTHNGPREKGPF